MDLNPNTPNIVYLHAPSQGAPVPLAFKARKVNGLPVIVSQLMVFTYTALGHLYRFASDYVVHVLNAQVHRQYVSLGQDLDVLPLIQHPITWFPRFRIGFGQAKGKAKNNGLESWAKDQGFTSNEFGGYSYFTGYPTKDQIEVMFRRFQVKPNEYVPKGSASLVSFTAMGLINKLLTALAAFVSHEESEGTPFLNLAHLPDLSTPEKKTDTYRLARTTIGTTPIGTSEVSGRIPATETKPLGHTTALNCGELIVGPSDVPENVLFCSYTELPTGEAILFPFFSGLLLFDNNMIPMLIQRYLARYLSKNSEVATAMMETIRNGWNDCYRVGDAAEVYNHYAFGIQLALNTGSRLLAIVERNAYCGFALYRKGLKIKLSGTVYQAKEKDIWFTAARPEFQTQSVLRAEICEKLSGIPLLDGSLAAVPEGCEDEDYLLALEIAKRDIHSITSDGRLEFQALLNRVAPSGEFLPVNVETVLELLTYIKTGSSTSYRPGIGMSFRGAVGSGNLDRVAIGLMAFGEVVPCFQSSSNTATVIRVESKNATRTTYHPDGSKLLKSFGPIKMGLANAIPAMRRFIADREMKLPVTEKKGVSGAMVTCSGDMGERLFVAIQDLLYDNANYKEHVREGKRRRDEEEEDEDSQANKLMKMMEFF